MTVAAFSQYLQQLEKTPSRLEMTAILAEFFQKLEPEEIRSTCYLLQGQILPEYEGLEFQVSSKTVIKVLARLVGCEDSEIERRFKVRGDLGEVTAEVQEMGASGESGVAGWIEQPFAKVETELRVFDLYEVLLKLAKEHGESSQQRKQDQLLELYRRIDPLSGKYVTRIVMGKLRLGFSDMTMIDALSWAMTGGKGERSQIEDAYQRRADIGQLAAAYLALPDEKERIALLESYSVEVGVPVVPALCQRLNTAAEVIEKMSEVIVEPKYDGLRVQIHFIRGSDDGKTAPLIRTFTRSLEESSHMFPELTALPAALNCQSCVLDAEAIGYDPATGALISFQQTVQRKRKHGVAEKALEIPVRFYVFDLLALDGKDLLRMPLEERKVLLAKLFVDDDIFVHTTEERTSDPQELQRLHHEALAEGLEGVVMKQTTAEYQSGRKGWSWVKMKETEGQTGKLNDTLDVIVMGYYMGRGKRAEFGIGAFLVGVWDEGEGKVRTVAKIGTGLSEDALQEVQRRCAALSTPQQPSTYLVSAALTPDVWCLPELVVEVAADELTTSSLHTAGKALRFPRFLKFRDDKTWQQATSLAEMTQIVVSG